MHASFPATQTELTNGGSVHPFPNSTGETPAKGRPSLLRRSRLNTPDSPSSPSLQAGVPTRSKLQTALLPVTWTVGLIATRRWLIGVVCLCIGLAGLIALMDPTSRREKTALDDGPVLLFSDTPGENSDIERALEREHLKAHSDQLAAMTNDLVVMPGKDRDPFLDSGMGKNREHTPMVSGPLSVPGLVGRPMPTDEPAASKLGRPRGAWLIGTIEPIEAPASAPRTAAADGLSIPSPSTKQ